MPVTLMTAAFLAPGCHCGRPANEGLDRRSAVEPALPTGRVETGIEVPTHARGMWVWSTQRRLHDPHGTSSLLETVERANLTEVYLSVNHGALDDPRLPKLMAALGGRGVRIEALAGEATWGRTEQLPVVLARIDAVAAYNAKHEARFAGVHLDIEPHQLPENQKDHAFVPELAAVLRRAREHAEASGLSMSADLPRFALDEHGPLLAEAVQRPFVMLYQLRERSPEWLVLQSGRVLENTYRGVPPELHGRLVVGLRMEDYPDTIEKMLGALDSAFGGQAARFGGWAVHDEAKYRARSTNR